MSTFENLSFDQDYFISWHPSKYISDIRITDHERMDEAFSPNDNLTKIYSKQLHLTPLQLNDLEWIKYCLTQEERDELLDKAFVICAAFYPKTERSRNLIDYKETIIRHSGVNEYHAYIEKTKVIERK
uniref:Uncharacterized protein n=1 Tax=Corynecladia elata TaxID=3101723 RepID=A0AA51NG39_9FLOR|nr:hypothetical protein RU988_pgp211 [Laurencia elata]WMP12583.1 hypothetical protein [Laurencia elata]